nr:hypothetical protein [Tanacetum cinerariifolium]
RQPNAFKSQRPSVLGKPTTFSNSFIRNNFSKSTSVTKNNASNDFSKPVTAQTLPASKKSCLKNTNVPATGMYKIPTDLTQARTSKLPQDSKKTNKSVSFSTGVIPSTSVSRPQLKSNPKGDRVMRNNSHGKKLEVEEPLSESKGESDEEETRQEEEGSFDLIPRTPKGSEEESNDQEDQELRLSEEARIQEEEEADELYRDVNINQGRGLQVTQNVEDPHVTLTPVNPDGPQESSSVSSFVTSMLNPTSDVGVESIFTTESSPIVSLQTPTPIMTPSNIATITTSGDAPIPPTTIPSIILENLPTFNSAFRFNERLGSLETTFSEYR